VDLAAVVIPDVDAIHPGLAFLDVAFEDLPDRRVVDAVPGNVLGREELIVEGLRPELAGDLQTRMARKMMYTSLIFGTLKIE